MIYDVYTYITEYIKKQLIYLCFNCELFQHIEYTRLQKKPFLTTYYCFIIDKPVLLWPSTTIC